MAQKRTIVQTVISWFNFDRPTPNILVQKAGKGYFVKAYAGWNVVVQHGDGTISVHDSGLVFVPPLATADYAATHRQTRSFKFNDAIRTPDGVDVEAKAEILYEYTPSSLYADSAAIVGQPQTNDSINRCVYDIVSTIVRNSNSSQIDKAFDLRPGRIPNWLGYDAQTRIMELLNEIEQTYHCKLDCIHMCDFNKPNKIIQAEIDEKEQDIRLRTELKRAKQERQIELSKARTKGKVDSLLQGYHYRALHAIAKEAKLTSEQVFELIRTELLGKSKAVVVLGSNGVSVDDAAYAILGEYLNRFSDEKQSQQDTSGVSDEKQSQQDTSGVYDDVIDVSGDVIDVDYYESNEGPSQRRQKN